MSDNSGLVCTCTYLSFGQLLRVSIAIIILSPVTPLFVRHVLSRVGVAPGEHFNLVKTLPRTGGEAFYIRILNSVAVPPNQRSVWVDCQRL